MTVRASDIASAMAEVVTERRGDDAEITGLGSGEHCGPGDLVFVDREEFVAHPIDRGVAAVVTTPALADSFGEAPMAVLVAPEIKLARALISQRFFDRDLRPAGEPRVHPSASIHDTAEVAETAWVGAGAVVGAGASIAADAVLLDGVVVERDAKVGERSVLHPNVVLGFSCEIGADSIVQAGTVLGSEGFGFAQDRRRKNHRIPQLGNVVVGARVRIGANCCIDRGTHGSTRIGDGTIIDNLCHIAHNVEIGEDCILTAMLCVAGSTKIGNRVVTSGQVGIIDHLTISDDVYLVHRAGVTSDVKKPGAYGGVPLLPLKEHMKSQVNIRRLAQMRDQIRKLEERLSRLEGDA